MSAINKCIIGILLVCLVFVQTGCFQNISSRSSTKEEEPVVVILDEDSSNQGDGQSPPTFKTSKTQIIRNEYNVDLKVNPQEKTFEGIQKIQYANQTPNPLDMIYLNLYLNAFKKNSSVKPYLSELEDKVYKSGFDEGFIEIKSVLVNNKEVLFNQSETLLEISLQQPMEVDESIEITMEFYGKVPKIAHRIGGNSRALWMGNFLPTLAVYDRNGWNKNPYYPVDDPFYQDISNYSVNITTPKDYVVVTTGKEEVTETEKEKITTVNAQMVRDFAIAISNHFEKASLEIEDGPNINLYYTSDRIDTEKILNKAEHSIKYYNNLLGSYPYSQLDIIEGELYSSTSTEYSTVILIDSKNLKNAASASVSIAHGIGHQWFYNIIGSNQVKEPWLDEAMVMYLQENILYSEEEVEDRMDRERRQLIDALESMREISLYSDLSTFSNWESYYNIHYNRGKLMVYALEKTMGKEKFQQFLKSYYEKYAFQNVDAQGFIDTAEEIYGSSLRLFFHQWMKAERIPRF